MLREKLQVATADGRSAPTASVRAYEVGLFRGARIALEAALEELQAAPSYHAEDRIRALLAELDPQHQGKAGRP